MPPFGLSPKQILYGFNATVFAFLAPSLYRTSKNLYKYIHRTKAASQQDENNMQTQRKVLVPHPPKAKPTSTSHKASPTTFSSKVPEPATQPSMAGTMPNPACPPQPRNPTTIFGPDAYLAPNSNCTPTFHDLICGHSVETSTSQACGANCYKPLDTAPFHCPQCHDIIKSTVTHRLSRAEDQKLNTAFNTRDEAKFKVYFAEYVASRIAGIPEAGRKFLIGHAFEMGREAKAWVHVQEYWTMEELYGPSGLPSLSNVIKSQDFRSSEKEEMGNGETKSAETPTSATSSPPPSAAEPAATVQLAKPGKRQTPEPSDQKDSPALWNVKQAKRHRARLLPAIDKAAFKQSRGLKRCCEEEEVPTAVAKRNMTTQLTSLRAPKFAPEKEKLGTLIRKRGSEALEEGSERVGKKTCENFRHDPQSQFAQDGLIVRENKRKFAAVGGHADMDVHVNKMGRMAWVSV